MPPSLVLTFHFLQFIEQNANSAEALYTRSIFNTMGVDNSTAALVSLFANLRTRLRNTPT